MVSWNAAGLRSKTKLLGSIAMLTQADHAPDIIAFQETGISADQLTSLPLPTKQWIAVANTTAGRGRGILLLFPPKSSIKPTRGREACILSDINHEACDLLAT